MGDPENIAAEQAQRGGDWLLPAATIFCGAFLLFELEPLVAKMILPWFGGSAQVWATCLLFFQAALLCGYLYAHVMNARVPPRWQIRIHLVLLAASLLFLPLTLSQYWKPVGGENPLPLILGLLTTTIGLPFLLLSSTSPLVQAWLARGQSGGQSDGQSTRRSPYPLFALSNLGSMLALLSYPTLVEPSFTLELQSELWSGGFIGFVLLFGATALRYGTRGRIISVEPKGADGERSSREIRILWFVLAAIPSALLLAVTNYILQNIAAIPLYWTVPLALYLLSFIFAFATLKWFFRPLFYVLLTVALAVMMRGLGEYSQANIAAFVIALFVCCLVCHGEVAALKPATRELTAYYLIISAGGVAGGLFVALAAPLMFNASYELPILLPLTGLAVTFAAWRRFRNRRLLRDTLFGTLGFLLAFGVYYVVQKTYEDVSNSLALARNFYGTLQVGQFGFEGPDEVRSLRNGIIDHGQEYTDPDRRRIPLTYYSRISGLGISLEMLASDGPLHVGMVGLGTGTIAAYGRQEDRYRFYEINPLVPGIAKNYFWYLGDNPAQTTIVLGDGRLSLEREWGTTGSQQFDLLALDAFIGDAIPIHLLTREAFQLYAKHLKKDGVLAVHVSNKYVDLVPVVAAAAKEIGFESRVVANEANDDETIRSSLWVLVTARPGFFDLPTLAKERTIEIPKGFRPWTDDYSNLWRVLKFR